MLRPYSESSATPRQTRTMRLLLTICVLTLYLNNVQSKADWDTFDKYRNLIRSQGVVLWKPCVFNRDIVFDFRQSLYNVTIETYRKISAVSNSHFVFSPYSMWLTLGAIAEGASGGTLEELSRFLMLPQDECFKKQYYQLASTLEPASEDVVLSRISTLILDDGVNMNFNWENFVRAKSLLRTSSAPMKSDPTAAAELIRRVLKLQLPSPNFEGNSLIVDTLNFEGLWTEAFSDAHIEKAPFYNDVGKKIGYVDLMKIKKRVKMAYMPAMNAKILELPVGFGSRYRMLFAMNLGTTEVRRSIPNIMDTVFFEILNNFKESIIPLEVAIPRFRMTTEIDMRTILEEMGVHSLWHDVEGTRNISEPAALPSSFIQRTTVTFDSTGVRAPIQEVHNIVPSNLKTWNSDETGLDPILGRDFIVDRPFLFGLFDSQTYTCLFCAAFSTPTYKI